MIYIADGNLKPVVRGMWKTCFGDSDEFMDLYFKYKYRDENTLVYFEKKSPVASLQMLPYSIRFYGSVLPVYYISGACTLPGYREKGIMKQLLMEAYKIMEERKIPLSILIPAEKWLYGYYSRYGYEKVFDRGTRRINLSHLLQHDLPTAFRIFDEQFQQRDFCLLKNEEDFRVIMKEYIMENCPDKTALSGMARVIDAFGLLKIYAGKNRDKSFRIRVTDEIIENGNIYIVENGNVYKVDTGPFDLDVNINMLCRLLFGYHTNELPDVYSGLFPVHKPVMSLMLE